MRLILVGCEYAGKTTLADSIARWIERTMGPPIPQGMPPYHDSLARHSVASLLRAPPEPAEGMTGRLSIFDGVS